jgi:spermidine synthase
VCKDFSVKRWETLGTAHAPDGSKLTLRRHDGDFYLAANGYDLMTSRMHASEERLVDLGCEGLPGDSNILIGGLGMGYSLRAALDRFGPEATITVAELLPEVVEWNRGPLAHLAGNPLDDSRVTVILSDITKLVQPATDEWHAILLDVDNGPDAETVRGNNWLYTNWGLSRLRDALKPGGCLAVWSVDSSSDFVGRLARSGFNASVHRIRAREEKGPRHGIYIGRRR